MDEIRQWWAQFLGASFAALGKLWKRFASGVADEWNVTAFILAMGVVVIVIGISMWRRRA